MAVATSTILTYSLLVWLILTIVGLVLASIHTSRVSNCRTWHEDGDKVFAVSSTSYMIGMFAMQILLILFLLYQNRLYSFVKKNL